MAKAAAKTTAKDRVSTTSKKMVEKEEPKKGGGDEFKYGVEDLAEALDVEPATARIRLRNAGIEKAKGLGRYGWKTKADLQEVIDELKDVKSTPKKEEKPAPKKAAAKDEKPKGKVGPSGGASKKK